MDVGATDKLDRLTPNTLNCNLGANKNKKSMTPPSPSAAANGHNVAPASMTPMLPPCALSPSSSSVLMSNGIEISALDDRVYETFQLDNQLQVLIISDPKTEKASAAMDVHVGHQSDPEELPGLAHFLEHMLFLGTSKYPDENSYKQFLSAHSGRSNASTSQMHTNYYFDVLSDFLPEALDRFAQFFIAPLFTASATDREMNAVNSENAKNLQNDHRRLYQLQKSLSNPQHPFHKFGTGNMETLGTTPKAQGIDARTALLQFHETYYSASIMKLVIYGKEDLATLKKVATDLFSAIKTTGRSFATFGDGIVPYDASHLAREIHVAPVKDLRTIDISWPLPSLYWHHLTKPSRILSHLIGHEGKGSMLSFLKAKKWANGLSSGLTRDNEDWSLFSVKIEATEEGMHHVDEVVNAVYQYIHLLQHEAPFPAWIFEETKNIALVEFRFKSKESPINYTSYLAGVMHKYPPQHIVSGGYLLYEYDAAEVQRILDLLTPQRMRLTVVSKQFEGKTESIEQWYKTPYTERAIPVEKLQVWQSVGPNASLALPHRNEFICTDFGIVTPAESTAEYTLTPPLLLHHNEQSRVWFKPDVHFRKPKLHTSFVLFTPTVSATPYQSVLTGLLIRYLKDELTEYSYDAELAGMEYDVTFNSRAVEIHVGGFSHKLPVLLKKIVNQLVSMSRPDHGYEVAVFERLKDRTHRLYENFFLEEPYQHAIYASSLILEASKWSVDEKIMAIEHVALSDMVLHAQRLFEQVFVEAFIYGNTDATDARRMVATVVDAFFTGEKETTSLCLLPSQRAKPRVVQLVEPIEYRFQRKEWNAGNVNSSICNLYQFDTESLSLRARLELFAHIFKEPCFNQLRTQEQLGYLVFSGLLRIESVEYFRVLLQSDVASPALLDQRIELFMGNFRDLLMGMEFKEWNQHTHAVAKALREKPKRETEECSRFWREIASETYVFDRRERVAALVETLQKSDLIELFDEFLARGGSKRSKLSTHLYGNKHELVTLEQSVGADIVEASTAMATMALAGGSLMSSSADRVHVIKDIEAFKQSMPLFPERSSQGLTSAISSAAKL